MRGRSTEYALYHCRIDFGAWNSCGRAYLFWTITALAVNSGSYPGYVVVLDRFTGEKVVCLGNRCRKVGKSEGEESSTSGSDQEPNVSVRRLLEDEGRK